MFTGTSLIGIPVRDDAHRKGKENPNDLVGAFITIPTEYHRTLSMYETPCMSTLSSH